MKGYHIRIVLRPASDISSSQPQRSGAFFPTSIFQHLPAQTPKPTARQNALFNPHHKDYRFGPIRLDWVDFEDMSKAVLTGKEREQRKSGTAIAKFVPHTRTKTGSTNLPEGVVHVFRQNSDVAPINDDTERSPSSPPDHDPTLQHIDSDGIMMAVLAVPSWMTPSDFLAFVAPAAEGMAHLRMVRDSAPNRSIVLIKFRNTEDASEFAEAYDGKPFNSMDPELCHVVHVLSVVIQPDDHISLAMSRISISQGAYELPTCPVCLERMDSAVTGLVTVPCSHTFHCRCLSQWGDSRCPVCRYSQTLLSSHPPSSSNRSSVPIPFTSPSTPSLSRCADCSSTTNLWICLICGNIGCGRYGRAHAHAHYERTTHLYALELETQRVWDYAGDGYVHRLIQNKADGKLVELPSAASSVGGSNASAGGLGPGPSDALTAEKIEAIGIEYSYLLTSQLDSQRVFYEEQSAELKSQVGELKTMVERLSKEIEKERLNAKEEMNQRKQEEEERVAALEKERARADKRAEKATDLARRLEKELKEERAVSEGLLRNLEKMKERVEQADREKENFGSRIGELEDQLRDVMFFLEARTKIEQGDGVEAEAVGGSVELPTPSLRTPGKKRKPRKA
ncbi:zf-UBP-domain-containing protein [Heliocybe sulcata]|uniref:Zf-UBP-domain-containing protein n=1 Tax=Heliocybe sulcata TaxID=5364 RepID=A0A5C3N3R0_9AGAM|nr:zf-UBP-domain-containing protein [Heliocybe sulcata]